MFGMDVVPAALAKTLNLNLDPFWHAMCGTDPAYSHTVLTQPTAMQY